MRTDTLTGSDLETYIAAYNDIVRFPTLVDVALELEISYQTVRNKSTIIRAKARRDKVESPLISRIVTAQPKDANAPDQVSSREHARIRADALGASIYSLIQQSNYPVVNPETIVFESNVSRVYDRVTGEYVEKEGTPKVWVSDTLKVAPVMESAGRKFLFTGAQNDTEIHEEFWQNLKAYAEAIGAEIVVGPWTYETQWWSENNPSSRSYDPALEKHMCFGQLEIGEKFVFCGEMNTLPTATKPISDLTTYSRGKWAVFPHAKLQLKSVPTTNPEVQAHQVMTTGAVTKPKVIPRKAGIKSIFHHVIGATIVEFDHEGDIFCRPINADNDGSFYDLDVFVRNGIVLESSSIRCLVAGDIHTRKAIRSSFMASFGFDPKTGDRQSGSLLEVLCPQEVLVHDLHDNEARNHHHVHDNAHSFEMAHRNRESVLEEIREGVSFLALLQDSFSGEVTVVDSNHDIALERYVREGRYRNDGINIRLGLQLEDAYLQWREEVADCLDNNLPVPSFSLLEYAMRKIAGPVIEDVSWVHDGKSYLVDEIECGNHGFRGANGARGTVAGFAQLGRKMTIADKHSPEINDGVYVAGCMNLHHGYNKGPSGWAIAHVIQYHNQKRCLITLQNGKWRA